MSTGKFRLIINIDDGRVGVSVFIREDGVLASRVVSRRDVECVIRGAGGAYACTSELRVRTTAAEAREPRTHTVDLFGGRTPELLSNISCAACVGHL